MMMRSRTCPSVGAGVGGTTTKSGVGVEDDGRSGDGDCDGPRRPYWTFPWNRPHLAILFLLLAMSVILPTVTYWRKTGLRNDRVRVALCFFGISRSLRWTFPSIKSRIFDALKKQDMDYDIFVHTYTLKEINNKRTGEINVAYGDFAQDYRVLKPRRSLVTNQDDLDLAFPDPIKLTHYNWKYIREGTAPGVIQNVFRAYWSMMLVWGLMAEYAHERHINYDAVVLLRPDTWYHMEIDLGRQSFPLPDNVIFMPDFDTDKGPGGRKNDRFSYGSVTAMRTMFHRIDTLFENNVGHFHNADLDTEWVLGRHLSKHNISVFTMVFPVTRVRLDGSIPFFDHGRVQAVCELGLDPMACEMADQGFKLPTDGKR